MKKKISASTVILILIFLAGLSLLLYPTVSDYWNSFHQSQAIATYAEQVAQLDEKDYSQYWEEANEYNRQLTQRKEIFLLNEQQQAQYDRLLNPSGTGIMGYVEIPSIKCSLPIYHGTNDAVLQVAVGHLEWTSLPTGGDSTHCVVSGHRGLPSAKLFTDLDKLAKGDLFTLRVLDEILTYEVDQILVVLPSETGALQIEEGQDYCTLVTCTPYGINSHRLLVRGHRVENVAQSHTVRVTSDAMQIDPLLVAPVLALPILLILLIILLLPKRRQPITGGDDHEIT